MSRSHRLPWLESPDLALLASNESRALLADASGRHNKESPVSYDQLSIALKERDAAPHPEELRDFIENEHPVDLAHFVGEGLSL